MRSSLLDQTIQFKMVIGQNGPEISQIPEQENDVFHLFSWFSYFSVFRTLFPNLESRHQIVKIKLYIVICTVCSTDMPAYPLILILSKPETVDIGECLSPGAPPSLETRGPLLPLPLEWSLKLSRGQESLSPTSVGFRLSCIAKNISGWILKPVSL